MRKIATFLLMLLLLAGCLLPVLAEDASRVYRFELSIDGKDTKEVETGDIITVTFYLNRTDSGEASDMYAMQNEIRYDSSFFRLVDGSAMLGSGISSTDIAVEEPYREFYMNFVSFSGGESWEAEKLIGSFRLEVIGTSGVTKITSEDYLVSTADGMDSYKAEANDLTVILSTECTVKFQSNGGTEVPEVTAQYGETVEKPADPTREGYTFVGWYQEIDLENEWNFETDTVSGNMTLYAKWQKTDAAAEPTEPTQEPVEPTTPPWWILTVGGAGILLILLVLILAIVKKRRR